MYKKFKDGRYGLELECVSFSEVAYEGETYSVTISKKDDPVDTILFIQSPSDKESIVGFRQYVEVKHKDGIIDRYFNYSHFKYKDAE